MAITIRREHLKQIEQHGVADYPDECCGVLLGNEETGHRAVTDILPLKNGRAGNDNSLKAPPAMMELLRDAYKLMQASELKNGAMREWLERADGLINSSRNRFEILPQDLLYSDSEAEKRGVQILGFYHSHPDHPAKPSEYDREHACPWYTTYLILRVEHGVARELTGWLLAEDCSKFSAAEVAISDGAA